MVGLKRNKLCAEVLKLDPEGDEDASHLADTSVLDRKRLRLEVNGDTDWSHE